MGKRWSLEGCGGGVCWNSFPLVAPNVFSSIFSPQLLPDVATAAQKQEKHTSLLRVICYSLQQKRTPTRPQKCRPAPIGPDFDFFTREPASN